MAIGILRYLLAVCIVCGCGAAQAEVYDDFSGEKIDAEKWLRQEGVELFSQSAGRLSFPCKGSATDRLDSKLRFAPGFFWLGFRDYHSTNASPGGRGLGSYLAIGLSADAERVRTIRGDIRSGGYFEANHFAGSGYRLWYVDANDTAGQLGVYFDGANVRYFFKAGSDSGQPWRQIGPAVTPKWTTQPRLYVAGGSGGSGCTRFSIVKVEYVAAPLPAALAHELGL
jgi:hypothetical protein